MIGGRHTDTESTSECIVRDTACRIIGTLSCRKGLADGVWPRNAWTRKESFLLFRLLYKQRVYAQYSMQWVLARWRIRAKFRIRHSARVHCKQFVRFARCTLSVFDSTIHICPPRPLFSKRDIPLSLTWIRGCVTHYHPLSSSRVLE